MGEFIWAAAAREAARQGRGGAHGHARRRAAERERLQAQEGESRRGQVEEDHEEAWHVRNCVTTVIGFVVSTSY